MYRSFYYSIGTIQPPIRLVYPMPCGVDLRLQQNAILIPIKMAHPRFSSMPTLWCTGQSNKCWTLITIIMITRLFDKGAYGTHAHYSFSPSRNSFTEALSRAFMFALSRMFSSDCSRVRSVEGAGFVLKKFCKKGQRNVIHANAYILVQVLRTQVCNSLIN